MKSTLRKLWTI